MKTFLVTLLFPTMAIAIGTGPVVSRTPIEDRHGATWVQLRGTPQDWIGASFMCEREGMGWHIPTAAAVDATDFSFGVSFWISSWRGYRANQWTEYYYSHGNRQHRYEYVQGNTGTTFYVVCVRHE